MCGRGLGSRTRATGLSAYPCNPTTASLTFQEKNNEGKEIIGKLNIKTNKQEKHNAGNITTLLYSAEYRD